MLKKRAQSTLEFSILIAVIAAALLSMTVYMKRALQGRIRSSADEIGEQFSPRRSFGYERTDAVNSTITTQNFFNNPAEPGPFNSKVTQERYTEAGNEQITQEVIGDESSEPLF